MSAAVDEAAATLAQRLRAADATGGCAAVCCWGAAAAGLARLCEHEQAARAPMGTAAVSTHSSRLGSLGCSASLQAERGTGPSTSTSGIELDRLPERAWACCSLAQEARAREAEQERQRQEQERCALPPTPWSTL